MVGSLNVGASAREPYYLGQTDELRWRRELNLPN